ncbi:contact-dependent growth inhibition system immunity protein [Pseudomonas mosselii]
MSAGNKTFLFWVCLSPLRVKVFMKLPMLSHLLGCYFHQDWPEEYSDSAEALRNMLVDEPREMHVAGVREIDEVLSFNLSEKALEQLVVQEIGCFFAPDSEGLDYAGWLRKVREVLADGHPGC